MKPARSKQFRKGGAKSRSGSLNQDPVEVFCRVRPCNSGALCLRVNSPTTVQISIPESAVNYRSGNDIKEVLHTFKYVFDDKSSQSDIFETVALPLVSQLIAGKNGLLLTYGVTGSGKTYTMTGEPSNRGIMPRCLEVIFKTIGQYQAPKCTYKPDRMNGFEILDEDEAASAARSVASYPLLPRTPKTPRRREADGDLFFTGDCDHDSVPLDQDNSFSCFVTYIEIYNNNVFDLLDSSEDAITRKLQNRVLREDGNRNMYVHGVTEIEVKSPEEAFEVLSCGRRRKRMANTMLNSDSSRSHSVFTIRLIQAPLNESCDDALMQRKLMTVSQLSLVDLAGSERTNRTKNTGQHLREAGNINNSLLTLRKCLETLRENQMSGSNKMVPYRDSKITHLFKNYFDGEGAVRMIVCVNPRVEDYDETAHVLTFAEATQEVQVNRPAPQRFDVGLTPGRRRAPLPLAETPVLRSLPIFPVIPSLSVLGPYDGSSFLSLERYFEDRENIRLVALADHSKAGEEFRRELLKIEGDANTGKNDIHQMRGLLEFERKKVADIDGKLARFSAEKREMVQKLNEREQTRIVLEAKIEELERTNKQLVVEKGKLKDRYVQKYERLRREKEEIEDEKRKKSEAMRRVVGSVENTRIAPRPIREREYPTTPCAASSVNTHGTLYQPPSSTSALRGTAAVCNPRHRRSKSAGGEDRWLDHRPAQPVELSTIFQPTMRKRKSITKLTDKKDVINPKTSKYCLTTQEQDTDGELETKLYKGDVVPTCTGGAQVILNDVETLKQSSPRKMALRKRSIPDEDTSDRCRIAIEGHSKRPRS